MPNHVHFSSRIKSIKKNFEVIDTVITCIKERFDQEEYVMFATCEQVLLKAVRGQ